MKHVELLMPQIQRYWQANIHVTAQTRCDDNRAPLHGRVIDARSTGLPGTVGEKVVRITTGNGKTPHPKDRVNRQFCIKRTNQLKVSDFNCGPQQKSQLYATSTVDDLLRRTVRLVCQEFDAPARPCMATYGSGLTQLLLDHADVSLSGGGRSYRQLNNHPTAAVG